MDFNLHRFSTPNLLGLNRTLKSDRLLVFGDKGPGAYQRSGTYPGSAEDHGSHTDEAVISYLTGMNNGVVPHGDPASQNDAFIMVHMDSSSILYVGVFANDDGGDIAPQGRGKPNSDPRPQSDITSDFRIPGDKG
jgi:hypothetical protein